MGEIGLYHDLGELGEGDTLYDLKYTPQASA